MTSATSTQTAARNHLLTSLPPEDFRRVEPDLIDIPLALKQDLFEVDRPIDHVFFVHEGVISMIAVMEDGGIVESATVGNEGLVGAPLILGAERMPGRAFCQIPGSAARMTAADFRRHMDAGGAFSRIMLLYAQALMTQMFQGVACNRLHTVEERCARWLLMTQDRVGTDTIPLTQEFLAQMLGVRRASVTVVAGMLQQAGLITYRRGSITVLDRGRLEAASCECYRIIRREFERLVGSGRQQPATAISERAVPRI